MPVLTRSPQEELVIFHGDDEIVITALDSGGRPVKLGIDAPDEYEILRGELTDEESFSQAP